MNKTVCFTLILLFSMIAVPSVSAAECGDVKVWQPFNESSATDYSGCNNDGNLLNGTATGLFSAPNTNNSGSFGFDGVDDSVEIPDDSTLDVTNDFSISAWVYMNSSTQDNARILSKRGDGEGEIYALLRDNYDVNNGSLKFIMESKGYTYSINTPKAIPQDTWVHYTGVYDGEYMNLYKNGSLVESVNKSISDAGLDENNASVKIGSSLIDNGPFWGGQIDEPRIISRGINDTEASNLYSSNSLSSSSDDSSSSYDSCISTSICYSFNESSSPAIDYSGNNYDGVWNNGIESGSGIERSSGNWDSGLGYIFDGDDSYVDQSGINAVDDKENISISTWINVDDASGGSTGRNTIFGSYDGSNAFQLSQLESGISFITFDGNQYGIGDSGSQINSGEWYHVVGVFNTIEGYKVYINGSLEASDTSTTWALGTDNQDIGRRSDGAHQFGGNMDEFKVFEGKALNSTEVSDLYEYNSLSNLESNPPEITNPDPVDGALEINDTDDGTGVDVDLEFDVSDPEENLTEVNINWGNGSTIKQFSDPSTGSFSHQVENLDYFTYYDWEVVAKDNESNTVSEQYSFRTISDKEVWECVMAGDSHFGNTEGDGAADENLDFKEWIIDYNPECLFHAGDITGHAQTDEINNAVGNYTEIRKNTRVDKTFAVMGEGHDGFYNGDYGTYTPGWRGFDINRRFNYSSLYYTVEKGNNKFIMMNNINMDTLEDQDWNGGDSSQNKYVIPKPYIDWMEKEIIKSNNNNENVFVVFHDPMYDTTQYSKTWAGMDYTQTKTWTSKMMDVFKKNETTKPDVVWTAHVHSDPYSSFADNGVPEGKVVEGSFYSNRLPSGTTWVSNPVIAYSHGADTPSGSDPGKIPSVSSFNLFEGNSYFNLKMHNVRNSSQVGISYNNETNTNQTFRVDLDNKVSFENGADSPADSVDYRWSPYKFSNESLGPTWFKDSEGVRLGQDGWMISKIQRDSVTDFSDFVLNVSKKEDPLDCCNLTHDFASSNSSNDGYSSYYDNISDVPDGEWLKINSSFEVNSQIYVSDMSLSSASDAPLISIDSPVEGQTYSSSEVDLNVTSSEAVDTWEYSLDGGSNQTFAPNTTLSGLSDGSHTLDVYATDSSGNTGSDSVSFSVDANSAPTASFSVNDSSPEVNETVGFDASGSSDGDGSIDSYEWDLDDDGSYEASGVTTSKSFESAGDFSVKLRVTDNEGATGESSQTVSVEVNVSETEFDIQQDSSVTSDTDTQYFFRVKEVNNLGSGFVSGYSVSDPVMPGSCSNCGKSLDLGGDESRNVTYNSSGDFVSGESVEALSNASSMVEYGSGIDTNYSVDQSVSAFNDRTDIDLSVKLDSIVPSNTECSISSGSEMSIPADSTETQSVVKSCDPADEYDYQLVTNVNDNSTVYTYNGTVEVYSERTSEVEHEYWINQDRLTGFGDRETGNVNSSIDGVEQGLEIRTESRDGSDYLVMKALTNRTNSSIHAGTRYFEYEYEVVDSGDDGSGGTGGTGGGNQQSVTESPHDWSVTLVDSEYVGVFRPSVVPGESFEKEILVESQDRDLTIDVMCESETDACDWVSSDISQINFEDAGENLVTVKGQVPEDAVKDTYRFDIVFTDPAYEEGSSVGRNSVKFVVGTDSRWSFVYEFWNNLTGFYNGVPIAFFAGLISMLFFVPAWATGRLEKYPRIVPSVAFVIFLIVVGVF